MTVLRLPIPTSSSSPASATVTAAAGTSNGTGDAAASSPPRSTPSPVKSIGTVASSNFSTTPTMSNLGAPGEYFLNARKAAAAAVGGSSSSVANHRVVGNTGGGAVVFPIAASNNAMAHRKQQSFSTVAAQHQHQHQHQRHGGQHQQKRPASFLQMSQQTSSSMANGAPYAAAAGGAHPNRMVRPQQMMHHANNQHQRVVGGITTQQFSTQKLLPPSAKTALNKPKENPPWGGRMGAGPSGVVAVHQSANLSGNIAMHQSANPLGTVTVGGTPGMGDHNNMVGMGNAFGSRNMLVSKSSHQSANLLGTVTVGGAALGQPATNNLLGPVTVGERGGAMPHATTISKRDGMNKIRSAGRMVAGGGGAPPRPPLLPMGSASALARRRENQSEEHQFTQHQHHHQHHQQQHGLTTQMRRMSPKPVGRKTGVDGAVLTGVPNQMGVQNPIAMTEYHHGMDGAGGISAGIDFADIGSQPPPFMNACIPDVALTTGLVTLNIHEALTFNGVELALHPDVFSKGNSKNGKKKAEGKQHNEDHAANSKVLSSQPLRPGDLVEIRVWNARPGMAASQQDKLGSNLKSKLLKGARPSLHSRNTSLATVSSSISNMSMMNTPRSLGVPRVVGGDGVSTTISPRGSPGSLYGENLLETPTSKDGQAHTAIASNISSVFSGAASNLFRKISAAPSIDSGARSQGHHSRDSSSTTAGGGGNVHSRDSSLLTTSASWMNAMNEEISPPSAITGAMEPVSEGQPQPHPLITNISQLPESTQVLPMRRDSSVMAISSPGPTGPALQQVPYQQSSSGNAISGTSTPSSSRTSSPRTQQQLSASSLTPPVTSLSKLSGLNKNPQTTPASLQRPPPAALPRDMPDLPSAAILTSDMTFNPASLDVKLAANDPRRRASTADSAALVDIAPSSHHARNNSTSTTGALIPPVHHRRYRSSTIQKASSASFDSSGQILRTLSTATAGSNSQQPAADLSTNDNTGDAADVADINDMLQNTHLVRVSFVMHVSEGSLSSIKSGARTQVSLLRQVAELYGITAYDTVTVTQITRSRAPFVAQSVSADFLTITFKDQFVSRGDMYNFQKSFLNSWVYEGKRLSFNGLRTNTKVIRHGDHVIRSGLISEDTKLTFRSRSARIIWLVQMSSEMWDFASPYEAVGNQKKGDGVESKIFFDKFLDFVRRLFCKWKKLQLTHNLTIVFFSRTYIRRQQEDKNKEETSSSSAAEHVDSDGRRFEDHYKIVIDNETKADYDSLVHRMKQEFVSYPTLVKWDLTMGNERTPSTASQGNVLEAINITLNLLHLHYIDRDLHRTGNGVVIITPGNGVFEIEKNLAGITKQRMMDNGIGSDMLSLALPPLHVAPFFLFKEEKGTTTSAEEIQGFDDWKTYFEVPHWMNLSFVDYDDYEEEPMLYKEHLNDDNTLADATQRENEILAQTSWNASNGFMKRGSPDSAPDIPPAVENLVRHQYKHLISDRGFEDILQACRPQNRGEYGSGLPASLTILLNKTRDNRKDRKHLRKASLDRESSSQTQLPGSIGEVGCFSPQRATNASRRYLEWGAVNFDEYSYKRSNNRQARNRSYSGSQSSPSSSIGSLFPSQILGASHLQSTMSLEGGGQSLSSGGADTLLAIHKKRRSDASASLDSEEMQQNGVANITSSEKGQTTLSAIEMLMTNHDNNTFSSTASTHYGQNNNISKSHAEESLRNSINEPICPGSPMLEGKGILRSQSMFMVGGIEAALVQYDVTKNKKEDSVPREASLEASEEAAGQSDLAVSPLGMGMPYSLDRRNEGLRPSFMRLVGQDATPGFLPLSDFQRRNSFHRVNQIKIKPRDNPYQIKMPGQNTKENRLGDQRNQQDKLTENDRKHNAHQHGTESGVVGNPRHNVKATSPQRAKSKKQHGRKSHHHHSYRHRRKVWALNPFRQEDEDEVLAKRTHNRRRWSHVFPLGEDEFKRRSGPNWKSLCQPAILPMTIDFHPSPQELEDQAKFSVKQYSVTLPPMDETHYKSHKELLDDLLIQRMRQDFQLVPRNIIQQNARRDGTDLEATLSMGHKIQRLSYNTTTDSIDVVQYYARFAEDETPQTYRYLLWSALRLDYVSVFQTFTKYTLPYKWNELDMLISGDTVTRIAEGMRYPRISFVIIPDQFVNAHEENEYLKKFQRIVEYFRKISLKDHSNDIKIEMHTNNDAAPRASSRDKRFVVDLRKKRDDKYEWMELVHDSNCDTRRTFRMTIQWVVAVANKIDQQARLLNSRCSLYGLKLVSVPHFSCLKSSFMNPFAVPIKHAIHNKTCVDAIENALTNDFNFVYDGSHMSDPNEIDCLDGFDFVANKWSIKKRKKFVPARQYLHRSGTLFTRLLRDTRGSAMIIIYLNQIHIAGDEQLLQCARAVFNDLERFIAGSNLKL